MPSIISFVGVWADQQFRQPNLSKQASHAWLLLLETGSVARAISLMSIWVCYILLSHPVLVNTLLGPVGDPEHRFRHSTTYPMTNINNLTIDNCVVALIDHQPFVAFPVRSITPEELVNNVTGLAVMSKTLGVPTVLTTINAKGGPLQDPLFQSVQAVFPDVEPIDRNNTNAWSDPRFRQAVQETGRKKLVMCGLWTEVCLAQTVLSALRDGYEVYFISDASGGLSMEAHYDAKQLMIQAGARPLTWFAFIAAICPDNSSPEYQRLYEPTMQYGAGVGVAVQYVFANLPK